VNECTDGAENEKYIYIQGVR